MTSIIKCPLNKSVNENHADHGNDIVKFYLNLPYFGIVEGMLVKSTLEIQKQRNKQKKNSKKTKKSNIKSDARVTFKLSFYTNTKYRIDRLTHCHIVYKFCCPGYSIGIILVKGKNIFWFFERINVFKDRIQSA